VGGAPPTIRSLSTVSQSQIDATSSYLEPLNSCMYVYVDRRDSCWV